MRHQKPIEAITSIRNALITKTYIFAKVYFFSTQSTFLQIILSFILLLSRIMSKLNKRVCTCIPHMISNTYVCKRKFPERCVFGSKGNAIVKCRRRKGRHVSTQERKQGDVK